MTTSHPSSVWDGVSNTRPDGNVNRGLDGADWQRLVSEIISVSDQLDALGVSAAGVFATSDPDVGKRLFGDTLVMTLGGNSDPETHPLRWDKTTDSRPSGDDLRAPDYQDWQEILTRVNDLEKRVQPLGLGTAGVIPTAKPATIAHLWANGTDEIQSLAQISSTTGNWTLTITLPGNDPTVTASLAFDVNGAEVETAVDLALAGQIVNGIAFADGDISITGGDIDSGAITITYDGVSVRDTNIAAQTTADVDLNDSTPPAPTTTTPGVNGAVTVSDDVGAHTNVLWDGTSPSRPDADVQRGPDWQDYEEVRTKIREMTDKLVPIGALIDATLPTSDPSVRGEWWVNTLIVRVSAG